MISQESDELKLLHIEEQLSIFGEELCDELADAIEKRKLIRSGDLIDSLNAYSGGYPFSISGDIRSLPS